MTIEQLDKVKGVFFGQAIGDALGLGSEFMSKDQVQQHYSPLLHSYHQIIRDKHRSRWSQGDWTDDTDQFLAICESIIKRGDVCEIAFAEELYKWFSGVPMGIGQTVYKVLSLPQFTLYPHKAAEMIWKFSKGKTASNGAIMRTSIIGTYQFWNTEKVLLHAEKMAKVTHWDSRCVASCAIVSFIIASFLSSNTAPPLDKIYTIAAQYDDSITPYLKSCLTPNIESLALAEADSIGYTLKALSAALWCFIYATDFESGLIAVVNEGGDADTNASVAASILGAKFGFNAIPAHYVSGLRKQDVLLSYYERYVQQLQSKYQES
jgi:ADP-ribosylglycohydrolase